MECVAQLNLEDSEKYLKEFNDKREKIKQFVIEKKYFNKVQRIDKFFQERALRRFLIIGN